MAIVPAILGHGSTVPEKPFKCTRGTGKILLFCYDTDTERFLYLDIETDMPLTNEEAWDYEYFNQEK